MFIADGLINWAFWGTWVVLISTGLVATIITFLAATVADKTTAVLVGTTLGMVAFVLSTLVVSIIVLFPTKVLLAILIVIFLSTVSVIGSKFK